MERAGQPDHHHDHDHHDDIPNDVALGEGPESLLIEKGLVDPAALTRSSTHTSIRWGRITAPVWSPARGPIPHTGEGCWRMARPRSPSWATPAHRQHHRRVENSDTVHNLIVCTLCSCYPYPVLGLPPVVQIRGLSVPCGHRPARRPARAGSRNPGAYRSPRWDSTAEIRYMALPKRPDGTENMDEDGLAALVSRDAMIGVAHARPGDARP